MAAPGFSNGISGLIRQAEQLIESGNATEALKVLTDARTKDPGNKYIEAIMQRALSAAPQQENPESDGESGSVKASSGVSVSTPDAAVPQPDDTALQVKRFINVARNLYQRGSYEPAFETLMKAYLLDPLSEDVMKAEQAIVPALELMRKRGTLGIQPSTQSTISQVIRQHVEAVPSNAPELLPPAAAPISRLDQLKKEKEEQRLVKEREMWRKASEAPRRAAEPSEAPAESVQTSGENQENAESTKHSRGLFSRMKRRRAS